MPAGVAAELRRARPPRSPRGVVVFCTGLSGSGKSTLARDLRDALLERGDRTVSLLDGDLVRRLLSAGLTFSRADRDLNIARIGYVATEVARHGGIAICAPIAPYAAAREGVRRMVSEVGDFVLVHVSTPLEVCEARDRKGLYAQARAGVIGSFTGISDPYEAPDDADVVIDTSLVSRQRRGRGGARSAHPRRLARLGALRLREAQDGLFRVRRDDVLGINVDLGLVSSGSSSAAPSFEALAELAGLAADPAQPAVQLVGDDRALLVEQDVAEQRADDEGKPEQQEAACPGQEQDQDRGAEHDDPGAGVRAVQVRFS